MEYTCITPMQTPGEEEDNEEQKEGAVMMCQHCYSIHGKGLMKKKRRCTNDVSVPLQYPWKRADEEKVQQ